MGTVVGELAFTVKHGCNGYSFWLVMPRRQVIGDLIFCLRSPLSLAPGSEKRGNVEVKVNILHSSRFVELIFKILSQKILIGSPPLTLLKQKAASHPEKPTPVC